MALDPHELRRRETGERVVAGDPDETFRAQSFPDQIAFGLRALVVPQDGRTEHLRAGIQGDQSVHLPGEPDRLDVLAAGAGS